MLQEKVIEVKNSLNCKMNYIDYVLFAIRFEFLIIKASLELKKHKTINYAIYFLNIWVKILTHAKIL